MARNEWLRNFYNSLEWKQFRLALIMEHGPVCSRCKRLIADPRQLIGHHKTELTPENVHDRTISLNPERVELICRDCHDKEHLRFGFEHTGQQVFLVYGPPLSGKSTFVQQSKGRLDILVDINEIFAAMTGLPEYDKPDSLLPIARQMRSQLIDHIRVRFGRWHNAWIVGGYADKYQREKIIAETGAEPIFVEATADECVSRLRTDPRLRYRQGEYEAYIRAWFERFVP
ncbi:HNH endonuclease [Alicyclobacillus sp. ALC3]|uniref:HNH endonuclease n=1 Tax=Alicyclobacillus sp. ALC3 TaxID=2796143 RepID=UPI002377F7E2|nr:HNH endonuclease [Alicyclobacillus sp. ALC3]WDL98137.1 HNH endonuclease [Alicyclobacillus sp. ALC3]